ncbi:MAG TPA: glycosyltransferase family 4 protein [Gemmatimonadaceae bacterium]|nr:glycosyltransferase family 4 protein [Gemmatimonadaceae bacterium]
MRRIAHFLPAGIDQGSSSVQRRPSRAARDERLPSVLVVTPIYPWPGNPAEGIFVHRQVRNLVRLGHPVRVLAYHPAIPGLPRELTAMSWARYHPRWLVRDREQDGVRVEHIFYPQRSFERGDVVPDITDAASRFIERTPEFQDVDVVYAHWLWTGGAAALGLRDRFGWPVAAIARGSETHRWQSVHPHCRAHVERVIEGADLLLANCEHLRSRLIELLPTSGARARVARNGCDHTVFRPAPDRGSIRRRLGFAPSLKYFLCCATVVEHKGVLDLAVAWRRFSDAHPDWRLIVLGPAPRWRVAREFARIAGDHAVLHGQAAADQVVAYMQAADAYVQPSRLEGLSNATMEAMAVGLPVVSTSAGGQSELVRDGVNGWLVPTSDSAALRRAMEEVALRPELASALGVAARRTIVECFDPLTAVRGLSARLAGLHARGFARGTGIMSRAADAVSTEPRSPYEREAGERTGIAS